MIEHMGDIIAAEPVVRHIRRESPNSYIVWAVRERYRELVDSHPEIDAVIPLGCLGEWIFLARSRAFDRVIDLQVSGRDCGRCQLCITKSEAAITLSDYYHHGNLLHVFSRSAGLPVFDDTPAVFIPQADRDAVDGLALPEHYVALHCASNDGERDWTARKWRLLVQWLVDTFGVHIVEVGLETVVNSPLSEYRSLCGELSMLESAEVIRRAKLFIGVDSGPAHLANAARVPGVVLLGHFGPFRHRYVPYSGGYGNGRMADLLYADGPVSTLPLEHVQEAVRRRMRLRTEAGAHAGARENTERTGTAG